MNRLAHETSLYLRQHADNPVDWYPWGTEALDRAAAEDRPLLISIGYSSCHWCHVMAHESFEDPATAAVMNDHFVCIKIDREERPDLDAFYMQATLLLARQGGWPMTVFATPDGRPYFTGTYFPPVNRGSMPGFADVCRWMAEVYRDRGDDVEAQARELIAHIARIAERTATVPPIGTDTIELALAGMIQAFDTAQGGFGGAPKFPPSNVLQFLLESQCAPEARDMAEITLRRMADGGLRDQLCGGFHRYAVDDLWLVPHFEKMLYDNALLARAYVTAARDGDPRWREIAEQTLDYLLAEMELPGGGFAAAQDADSPGGEGAYFVWTPDEIQALVPPDQARAVMLRFGVTAAGNFEGRSILHAALPLPLVAERLGADPEPLIAAALPVLRDARRRRAAPARDDKLVAAWNGLAIAALADAAVVFARGDYLAAATRAADRILAELIVDGRLYRTLQDGVAANPGQLEDYADVAHGLLQLYAAGFDARWLSAATDLADAMCTLFADPDGGGFFATGSDVPSLHVRLRDLEDQPAPGGNGQAASVLVRLAGLTGNTDLLDRATAAVAQVADDIPRVPLSFGVTLGVIDALARPRREVAVVGAAADPRTADLVAAARAHLGPGDVLASGDPADPTTITAVPLLVDRPLVDGAPAAYVCERFACQAPVTDPETLVAALTR